MPLSYFGEVQFMTGQLLVGEGRKKYADRETLAEVDYGAWHCHCR